MPANTRNAAVLGIILIGLLIGTIPGAAATTTTTTNNTTTTTTTTTPTPATTDATAALLDRAGSLTDREARRLADRLAHGYPTTRSEGRQAAVWLLREAARESPRLAQSTLTSALANAHDSLSPATLRVAQSQARQTLDRADLGVLADRLPAWDVPADLADWATSLTTSSTSRTTTTTTRGNASDYGDAGYGVVDSLREGFASPNGSDVLASYGEGDLLVTGTEWHVPDPEDGSSGYVLVTVVNLRGPARLSVTDTNSYSDGKEVQKVDYREIKLPRGRFQIKLPARESKHDDQTISVGANGDVYRFSDPSHAQGPGILDQFGGLPAIALGLVLAFVFFVLAGYAVLSGEDEGVVTAGGGPA